MYRQDIAEKDWVPKLVSRTEIRTEIDVIYYKINESNWIPQLPESHKVKLHLDHFVPGGSHLVAYVKRLTELGYVRVISMTEEDHKSGCGCINDFIEQVAWASEAFERDGFIQHFLNLDTTGYRFNETSYALWLKPKDKLAFDLMWTPCDNES